MTIFSRSASILCLLMLTATPVPAEPNRTAFPVESSPTLVEIPSKPTAADIFKARVFAEPLVPVGGEPEAVENQALAAALTAYATRVGPDDFSSLTGFLADHPHSAWTASLLTDLGIEYYRSGHYSKAIAAWEQTWQLARNAAGLKEKAVADRAAGELAGMYSRLGRIGQLNGLLREVQNRSFTGPGTAKMSSAREALWTMQNTPGIAFRCGPLALDRLRAAQDPQSAGDPLIFNSQSTTNGFSLTQVAELSRELGMHYQMAFRTPGAPLLLPAVVNWKVGHYAALVREANGRYLLQDPTFVDSSWVTQAALDEEASGYFLVPSGPLPKGWRGVAEQEGRAVWGKGIPAGKAPGAVTPYDQKTCGSSAGNNPGMAGYDIDLLLVGLSISDTPVGYQPPVGPPVGFTVTYNQMESGQPANFNYSNLGQKWTFGWLTYILDNPTAPEADASYYVAGGGSLNFTGFSDATQSYAPQTQAHALLVRSSSNSYTMFLPNGAKKIFSQSDGSTGTSRRIFLAQDIDPAGNAVALAYDADLRITAITDAIGQATTLTYGDASDIYKITKVTDPFGRFATFAYDATGLLTNITDVLGLQSAFVYGANEFITNLITPYGTTTFTAGAGGSMEWLQATDPQGQTERVEYNQDPNVGIPFSELPGVVPQGMRTGNWYIYGRNTYYWNKHAFALAGGDHTKARLYHWLHTTDLVSAAPVLESRKEPLENRVWYNYDGQATNSLNSAIIMGTTDRPSAVGRVLEDGTSQISRLQYNTPGNLTQRTDPAGRTTLHVYDTNGVDLLQIWQTNGTTGDLLATFTYNSQHQVLAYTDASGQTTINTYNPRGQLLSTTDAKQETTTLAYDTNGYLLAVAGPLPGANDTTSFTYDTFGRIKSITGPDGYSVTNSYDVFDRPTQVTYPDGTDAKFTYDRLDLVTIQDRQGRQTQRTFNSLRQLVAVQDPLKRVTHFDWCGCGSLAAIIDPLGRITAWLRDVQDRVTEKDYTDGSREILTYEDSTSRLKSVRASSGQLMEYSYYGDDNLRQINYPNALIATPSVSFTYDASYNRVTSMQDGTGLTTYSYNPVTVPPVPGAGQLAAVAGPLPNSTVTYQYDPVGRVINRAINGAPASFVFDPLGRVTSVSNLLGNFNYTFDGATWRIASAVNPNGQSSSFTYLGNAGDRQLQQITNLAPNAAVLSTFLHNYTPEGIITNWVRRFETQTPLAFNLGYDAADQLTAATNVQGTTVLSTLGYVYDFAGNRTLAQSNSVTGTFAYNALNQLTSAGSGTNPGVSYQWDGANRLVAVVRGNQRTQFAYDGLGRRVEIVEMQNGTNVSDTHLLWSGTELCEARDATGATVTKRYYDQGVRIESGANNGDYFYTRDHLGSIRELVDAGGTVRARYDYDPYGLRLKLAGDLDADFGFTGIYNHAPSGLYLADYRAYDANLGRWISRDPMEESGGLNLYGYAGNDPVNLTDPAGLSPLQGYVSYNTPPVGWASQLDTWLGQNPGITKGVDKAFSKLEDMTPLAKIPEYGPLLLKLLKAIIPKNQIRIPPPRSRPPQLPPGPTGCPKLRGNITLEAPFSPPPMPPGSPPAGDPTPSANPSVPGNPPPPTAPAPPEPEVWRVQQWEGSDYHESGFQNGQQIYYH